MSKSYQINFTDLVNKGFIQVDPNTVNTETSLKLPGRTTSDYGELVLENLLHLLENFANNNPPGSPIEGQLWYDTTIGVDQLKVYDGTQFVSASNIKKTNSQPPSTESNIGDLWVDTTNQQLRLYNGNEWLLIGPDFSKGTETGTKDEIIIDITDTPRTVVTTFVNSKRLLIVSNDEFRPKQSIGFGVIKPGINIATDLKYYGNAEVAESLFVANEGNILAANFARRDKDNTFTRPIRIQNNGGISVGETPTIQMSVIQSNAVVRNLASGGNIEFRLTNNNFSNSVLTLLSNGNVGINKTNPTQVLDVVGNIQTSGKLFIDNTDDIIQTSTALIVNGTANIKQDLEIEGNTTLLGNLETADIVPGQSGRNIGTNNLRYNNIFAQSITADSFSGESFNGNLLGNATTATSWQSNVTLRFNGDVEATEGDIVFGTQGTIGIKPITLTLTPEFITNQTETTTIDVDDEILIIRETNGVDVIRKVKQEVLVSTVELIPVGMIIPFAGDVLPTDADGRTQWLFCDGSIVSQSAYNRLFTIIGTKFNGFITDPDFLPLQQFRLPDLRGRFPLGNTQMLNSGPAALGTNFSNTSFDTDSVVNDQEASQIGAKGGSATKTIEVENLPEHQHTLGDLDPDNETAFYASTNIAESDLPPGTDIDTQGSNLVGDLPGSSISRTGGVTENTGEDFSVVNPYQTINYIIYTGVST